MATDVRLRVLAFARIRELVGFSEREFSLARGAAIDDVWVLLARETPLLDAMRTSTRFARNGAVVPGSALLEDGDELALLPPVGGG